MHRAYHRFPLLWAFHVVHHSSEELDWLSTTRLHPVSQALNTAAVAAALLLAGLPVTAVVAANIVIGAAALLAHANVRWTLGPCHHLLVSPLFHQWHHARIDHAHPQEAGNFGAVFSVWDRLFGTWALPSSSRPVRFGVPDAPRTTILGLLLHPLRLCVNSLLASLKLKSVGLPKRWGHRRLGGVKLLLENLPPGLQDQRQTLAACLEAMDRVMPLSPVYLFGSPARGEARPDSDVDLCIVAEGAERQLEAARRFREAIWDVWPRPSLTLIPITPHRLSEKRDRRDHFFATILQEGLLLAA